MKAIALKETGGIENLILIETKTPQVKPNEVLIKVKAISINPVDGFVRGNKAYHERVINPQPGENVILGWDVSGTVAEIGNDVSDFKIGDDVFGMVNFPGHGKAYAEYVAAPADQLALKPENITYEEAAAATLAALTAWQSLVTYAKIKKGDKILIHAAAGGVGHYAIQIAKHFGAHVIGTGSAAKKDFIIGQGADEFIDYTAEKFEQKVRDADIVLDSIFGDHVVRSLESVKHGGRLISLLTFFTDEALLKRIAEKAVYAHRLGVVSSGEDMKQIAGLLANGTLHSHISASFSFEEIPQAQTLVDAGRTVGKVVITL
ncbi:NADP-dependent oxidoreductase [Dyadobacter fanqingshengii]|uniref:NADP-dependent oxidoreductase n=1 Tax=Dyadobacter fanqingshengii TaxID=2906443 RepID=A0A9X1P9H8_9BACT|nr:NADP-dependent oxidoreductase [Dyadobacter fanqingshengii]MCF0040154.1 NADP-dependent oxidoreductase [Dyadobacter fanqingshengii]USJ38094.1 NADP-dependent oxidoreductase [Dyadobacter fanqingshengii]